MNNTFGRGRLHEASTGENNRDFVCVGFFLFLSSCSHSDSGTFRAGFVEFGAACGFETGSEEPCAKTYCKLGTSVVSTDGGAIFSESLFLMIYVTGSQPRRVSVGTVQRVVPSLRTAGYRHGACLERERKRGGGGGRWSRGERGGEWGGE